MISWLLIHGAGGGGWEWHFWAEALRERGDAVSTPTLAVADRPLAEVMLEHYGQQLLGSVAAISSPVIVVGASMGGLLALWLAERHPCRALVLINSVPPADVAPSWHQPEPSFPPVIPWGDEASLDETRAALPDAEEATIAFATSRWRNESGQVLAALSRGVPVVPPTVPTLVLASTEDRDVPPEVSGQLADWAGADYASLEACSHVGPLLGRRWRDAYQLTLAWVDGLALRGQSVCNE